MFCMFDVYVGVHVFMVLVRVYAFVERLMNMMSMMTATSEHTHSTHGVAIMMNSLRSES